MSETVKCPTCGRRPSVRFGYVPSVQPPLLGDCPDPLHDLADRLASAPVEAGTAALDAERLLTRATEWCCSCGGKPGDDETACAACKAWHYGMALLGKPTTALDRVALAMILRSEKAEAKVPWSSLHPACKDLYLEEADNLLRAFPAIRAMQSPPATGRPAAASPTVKMPERDFAMELLADIDINGPDDDGLFWVRFDGLGGSSAAVSVKNAGVIGVVVDQWRARLRTVKRLNAPPASPQDGKERA